MRKVFILGLLAASVSMPAAAMAQRGEGWRGRQAESQPRAEQSQQRQERRAERQQARQENRSENRVERREARQERREARQQQPVVVQRQERRQERVRTPVSGGASGGAWIGDRNDPRMEEHRRRYERLDRENARRNGSDQQYRDLVREQGSQREARREDRQERREDRRDWREDRRDWRADRRDDRRDWRADRRENRRDWNRGWRNDNRYDWQRYRNSNRFVFRVQPYYSPYRGYGYNRFGIGNILDRLFWGQNYWIRDPWTYRLPAAPYGYQWVRYYNDVVLVDTYNGEIVDVIYDFFW